MSFATCKPHAKTDYIQLLVFILLSARLVFVCLFLCCGDSLQDDFDVDQFVSECRKKVQLEEMREDLELYYMLLKTAMVELINKDYADFVNLSTNLVI